MDKFKETEITYDDQGYQVRNRHHKYQIGYDEQGYQRRVPLRDGQSYDPKVTFTEPVS